MKSAETAAALLSARVQQPAGYARIVRDETGRVLRATGDCELVRPSDAQIREVVAGAYWFRTPALRAAIVPPAAMDRKYNLTEFIAPIVQAGGEVIAIPLEDPQEALGVYSEERARLAESLLATRVEASNT